MNSRDANLQTLELGEQLKYLNTLVHDEFEETIMGGSEVEDYDEWTDFMLDCMNLMIPKQRNGE